MKGFGMIAKGNANWIEKPDPVLTSPYDAIVKVSAVAMCTSDVHFVESGMLPSVIGNIIGHEAIGIVEEVGSEVKEFKPGDRVVLTDISPYYGDMISQSGLPNHSPGASRTTNPKLQGMFSERILFERADTGLAHIPDSVSDVQALMVADMVPTALTGVEYLDIKFGESVAIIGIGPVGLVAVEAVSISGAGKIIAVGSRPICKETALNYGANVVIDYHDGPIVEQVIAANGGKPVDKVLVCGGDGNTLLDAFRMCRVGGTVSNLAVFMQREILIPALGGGDINYRSLNLKCGRLFLEQCLSLIENGRLHPEHVVSHVFNGFDKIPDAFEVMSKKGKDVIKSICIY